MVDLVGAVLVALGKLGRDRGGQVCKQSVRVGLFKTISHEAVVRSRTMIWALTLRRQPKRLLV